MTRVLVTGAAGFIGTNLMTHLRRLSDVEAVGFDIDGSEACLEALGTADAVLHLAGVNRPKDATEFVRGNVDFTRALVARLLQNGRPVPLAVTSSVQAALDNPYGQSKRRAEEEAFRYQRRMQARVAVYRLPNVFGKWCRPFYNSVVATFCHQAARSGEMRVDDPARVLHLVYVDDVVSSLARFAVGQDPAVDGGFGTISPTFEVPVGTLAETLRSLAAGRRTGNVPDLNDGLLRRLWATFLSYLPAEEAAYSAQKKEDQRGFLYELVRNRSCGQVFVSRTRPGVTRGNHYHDSKVEKFCIVEGSGRVTLRHIISGERVSFDIEGGEGRVVDILPGWSHSISNTGTTPLVTIFWASEVFDPQAPDTHPFEV